MIIMLCMIDRQLPVTRVARARAGRHALPPPRLPLHELISETFSAPQAAGGGG